MVLQINADVINGQIQHMKACVAETRSSFKRLPPFLLKPILKHLTTKHERLTT